MPKIVRASQLLLILSAACSTGSDDAADGGADTASVLESTDTAIQPPTVSTASGCTGTTLQGAGVGELRIGTSLAAVKRACLVRRDTTVTGAEGMPARIASVDVGGEAVGAEIVDDKVWRLAIRSPRFRTRDSLGVGTSLARLLELPAPRGMMGEGALYFASPAHCGLSFRLSENRPLPLSGQKWNAAALRRLPPSTRVTEVLAVGC